jgi:hypothetical protein
LKAKVLVAIKLLLFSCYGILAFPFPLYAVPGLHVVGKWVQSAYGYIITAFANTVLGFPNVRLYENGSGDSLYNWVGLGLLVLLASSITLWSVLVYKTDKIRRFLNSFFLLFFRYYLAYFMIYYGLVKFYRLQFAELSFDFLTTELSDATPLNLMWFFFSYSHIYNVMLGVIEVGAGLMLFWRRTTLLGALISMVVMMVIVPMNFVYNVPVKLYASHTLLAAIIVVISIGYKLPQILLGHTYKLDLPDSIIHVFPNVRLYHGVKWFVILSICYYSVKQMVDWQNRLTNLDTSNTNYGLYEVQKNLHSPIKGFPGNELRYIIIDDNNRICLKNWNGEKHYVAGETSEAGTIYFPNKTSLESSVTLSTIPDSLIQMEGIIEGDSLLVMCKKLDKREFTLLSREPQWVSPRPDHNDINLE